jgi:hypothetical protein
MSRNGTPGRNRSPLLPWFVLALVAVVAGLAALGGWQSGRRSYPIDQRATSGPVAAGAQFAPPRIDAPAAPAERAVAAAVQRMDQDSLPDDPVDVTFGHLTSQRRGIDADVWLVTFPGYCTLSTGTPGGGGAPTGIARTLVVVDASTGDVMTTLVDVDWRAGCQPGMTGASISA